MRRVEEVVSGILIIVFGIIIYPYYFTYMWTPFRDIVLDSFPSMSVLTSVHIAIFPYGALIFVLILGALCIIGKINKGNEQE